MSECSIHPNTKDEWIASMQDSLAKTLALLESKQELLKEPDRGFIVKSCVLVGLLDPNSFTWRMWPLSRPKDLKKWSKTWPRWGMTVDGVAYAHLMWERTITVTDGGDYFATPTTQANQLAPSMMKHKGCRNLGESMLPTPTAPNAKEEAYPAEGTRNTPTLSWVLGGKINPEYTEWMMGWPLGWTDLKQSETVKSRSKRQSRSKSSVKGGCDANP
jgi:hypothetical protein